MRWSVTVSLGAISCTENLLVTFGKPEHNLHQIRHTPITHFCPVQCFRTYMAVWTKQDAFSPTGNQFFKEFLSEKAWTNKHIWNNHF